MTDTCSMCWFQEHDAVKAPYPGCPCCANNHGIEVVDGEVVAPQLNGDRPMIEPDLRWFADNFEPVRPEAWPDAPDAAHVCRACGALVFRYAAAWHLRWHRER